MTTRKFKMTHTSPCIVTHIIYICIYIMCVCVYVYTHVPVGQMVKNLPAMPEASVRSLVWEDPLEKEMATHSSVLDWGIP